MYHTHIVPQDLPLIYTIDKIYLILHRSIEAKLATICTNKHEISERKLTLQESMQ